MSQKFNKAAEVLRCWGAEVIRNFSSGPTEDEFKEVYALYKQSTSVGDVGCLSISVFTCWKQQSRTMETWTGADCWQWQFISSAQLRRWTVRHLSGSVWVITSRNQAHSLWSRFLFEMSHPVVPNQIGMSDLHNYFIEFYCIIILL